MKRLEPSSALNPSSTHAPGDLSFLSLTARGTDDARSMGTMAIAGLLLAATAANLLCLSPRWYSNRFIAFVYEPVRFVALTAVTGATAVWIVWGGLNNPPAAGPARIARHLSGGWVFLPCFVLLYERDSPWMLFVLALVTLGMALGLRRLLPAAAPSPAAPAHPDTALPSLYGLPPADSPLRLATWIAIFAQASFLLALGDSLLLAAYALSVSVFLLAWRWSASDPRAAQWWTGRHPPLRQTAAAILLTSMTLIPFSAGGNGGRRWSPRSPPPDHADADSGYYGIILYPPPAKKQIIAPAPHTDSLRSAAITRPVTIPFDGAYWYFKAPSRAPSTRAHIAHAKPTDVNVRSTDYQPLRMEAHQNLGLPIPLDCCGEIDLALTNADTRPGVITLAVLLTDATSPGHPVQWLGEQTVASSQAEHIPPDRAPVKEILRFRIPPATRAPRRFNQITILFQLANPHSRTGAKISIDSFELIPKP